MESLWCIRKWHTRWNVFACFSDYLKFTRVALCPSVVCVQCACITGCGNFAILGMTSGHLEMYNMQSGLHRGVFGGGKGERSVFGGGKGERGVFGGGKGEGVFGGWER